MNWYETDWQFVSSQGAEITAGELLVNVGTTGGSFFLEERRTHNRLELAYGAIGLGVGISLIPFGIDYSLREFPTIGLGKIMARDSRRLYQEDFAGWFIMDVISGGGPVGGALTRICFNVPLSPFLGGMSFTAKALGTILGSNAGIQTGGTAMKYYGNLQVVV